MNIFYTPDIVDNFYTLSEDESKHCIRVMRMKAGEEVKLVDGKGGFYKAHIIYDNAKACELEVFEAVREFGKRPYNFHLAVAPTKNTDRIEWLIEKAVEIGITEFTPILCEHSERKHINTERLERVVISAMKQSLKAYKPIVNECVKFNQFIASELYSTKLIAHCANLQKESISNCYLPHNDVVVLIGPEGDFSNSEIEAAQNAGFFGISLGPSRLRTETAGLVACHAIYFMNHSKS